MIKLSVSGNFDKTAGWMARLKNQGLYSDLDRFGQMGVDALSAATPVRTGHASVSWRYRIVRTNKRTGIEWYSTDQVRGTPVVILLQYGHATGTGGYVRGRDFINPAMRPIFDQIANNVWGKVVKS